MLPSDLPIELHDLNKLPGIYFALLVSPESKEKISHFCIDILNLDMNNCESPYEKRSHTTLFSSVESHGKSLEHYSQFMNERVFNVKASSWDILISPNTNKRCLILKIHSEDIIEFHNELSKKSGLVHCFNHYSPHISIHYDYQGSVPEQLPEFDITLQEMYSKPYFYKTDHPQNRRKHILITHHNNRKEDIEKMPLHEIPTTNNEITI